ncbi:hypothetical protein SAMN04515691_3726 [Leifsonia sp. 98AMF]|nr:hypothetical protein SAMN04515690_0291 [Leifsonia sp. 197AMF]SDJ39907.1 hypothetical protein SAMN04515684_3491 [Leifsonia sp. 466MF]SDK38221.1 hypothetical protein SAMN04515683_3273 [Leifsonia sp. 157MF]SDN60220.1 hypothetical protein SAMN04515686_1677 [Leifsonia sp. 509MF]SEN49048.1 hypothetical protein SAMN04515685_3255 [Leifsonia sp. 467MF]SFM83284.1 hypothetical protein SAMN04515691_3726 [Leifsonia sp. 98AMF]
MRVVRVGGGVLLGVALVAGLMGCGPLRDRLRTPDPPVKELQRESALYYRDEYQPNVEKVRFTRDGDRPGFGASWCTNAIATVAGSDYHVIIGPETGPAFVGGDGAPPEAPAPPPDLSLTIVYSDGTSEVIE